MKTPPKKEARPTADAPANKNTTSTLAKNYRVSLPLQACAKNVDNSPLVCSAQKSGERESRALLCFIAQKLAEIEAQLHSPLAVRQLHLRYCARCGERVTNQNVGGYEGRSALTGDSFAWLALMTWRIRNE